MKLKEAIFYGEIIDESMQLNLAEFCQLAAVNVELVHEMIQYGIVEPNYTGTVSFSGVALHRLKVALRLRDDLGINMSGVALALELLEEIDELRRRLG